VSGNMNIDTMNSIVSSDYGTIASQKFKQFSGIIIKVIKCGVLNI
jgi:hypothetical protein